MCIIDRSVSIFSSSLSILISFEYLSLGADVEVESPGACGSCRKAGVTFAMVIADLQGGGCATSITSFANPLSIDKSMLAMYASPTQIKVKTHLKLNQGEVTF